MLANTSKCMQTLANTIKHKQMQTNASRHRRPQAHACPRPRTPKHSHTFPHMPKHARTRPHRPTNAQALFKKIFTTFNGFVDNFFLAAFQMTFYGFVENFLRLFFLLSLQYKVCLTQYKSLITFFRGAGVKVSPRTALLRSKMYECVCVWVFLSACMFMLERA